MLISVKQLRVSYKSVSKVIVVNGGSSD